ncbi:hypothetical protein E5288_WYG016316 [Bos mutus]|uniref:Uncharacterized protein n=1 Tax=Bos mutus TaxID=72004 RepID=A0A6B0RL06_9CETA|nr:hypothetical protein [Bos mutus]
MPSAVQTISQRAAGVQLLSLLIISLGELQEAGLDAGGALRALEAQLIPDTRQVLEIHAQILNPETATFPNCGQLGRLETCET